MSDIDCIDARSHSEFPLQNHSSSDNVEYRKLRGRAKLN